MLRKVFGISRQKTYKPIVMLKNKVKSTIQNKFNFNPYSVYNASINHKLIENTSIANAVINNDGYIAVEKNSYSITIPNYLKSPSFKTAKPLLISVFCIYTNEMNPILLYLLCKDNEMNFIHLPPFNGGKNNKREAVEYIKRIIPSAEISYAGYSETNENNIILLKAIYPETIADMTGYYWATTHEIMNLKSVVNIPVAKNVINVFNEHLQLLVLRDVNDLVYTSPMIGYYRAKKIKNIKNNCVDIFKDKIDNGYYYFFNATMPTNIEENETVIRSALFLTNPALNNTNKDIEHDSIIFNKNKNNITYAIKNYSQHFPLSYHSY
jgi:hypothetical protein